MKLFLFRRYTRKQIVLGIIMEMCSLQLWKLQKCLHLNYVNLPKNPQKEIWLKISLIGCFQEKFPVDIIVYTLLKTGRNF